MSAKDLWRDFYFLKIFVPRETPLKIITQIITEVISNEGETQKDFKEIFRITNFHIAYPPYAKGGRGVKFIY